MLSTCLDIGAMRFQILDSTVIHFIQTVIAQVDIGGIRTDKIQRFIVGGTANIANYFGYPAHIFPFHTENTTLQSLALIGNTVNNKFQRTPINDSTLWNATRKAGDSYRKAPM